MNNGWVRVWRRILDGEVFQDPILLKVFLWCLLKASYKAEAFPVKTGRGVTIVTLEPGQFIFGRNQAAEKLKIPPATVQRKMTHLGKLGFLVLQPVTHYSIISIAKWDTYQGTENQNDQANDQPTINQRSHTRMKRRKEIKDIVVIHHKDEESGDVKVSLKDGVREVLDFLNRERSKLLGTDRIRPMTASGAIEVRLKEGRSVMELCRVILTKAADRHFKENPHYLRPQTLFSKSNFEKYVDEAEILRARRTREGA